MEGYPDFRTYCNRCVHRSICTFYEEFENLDSVLHDLTSRIKEQRERGTQDDVDFYGLIVLPKPCPFFVEKNKEAEG